MEDIFEWNADSRTNSINSIIKSMLDKDEKENFKMDRIYATTPYTTADAVSNFANNTGTGDTAVISDQLLKELIQSGDVVVSESYKKKVRVEEDRKKKAADIWHYKKTFGKAKVIINDPAVILMIDGQKYVSKAMKGEPFDPEKGLLMCLFKWKGNTNSDLKRLLKNAHVESPEEKNKKVSKNY